MDFDGFLGYIRFSIKPMCKSVITVRVWSLWDTMRTDQLPLKQGACRPTDLPTTDGRWYDAHLHQEPDECDKPTAFTSNKTKYKYKKKHEETKPFVAI
jgi:hypothetical protein